MRLFNPTGEEQTAKLYVMGVEKELRFGKYEIKTVRYSGGRISETNLLV